MTSFPITCPSCSGPAVREYLRDRSACDTCDACVRVWITPKGARGPQISYVPPAAVAEAHRLFPRS